MTGRRMKGEEMFIEVSRFRGLEVARRSTAKLRNRATS